MNRQNQQHFILPVTPDTDRAALGWLLLGIFSLLTPGLYAISLVMSRTPGISEIFPWVDSFHIALVLHVDLTVLIWFLSFAGVLWSLNNRTGNPLFNRFALWLATLGTVVIVVSPFLGAADPLQNNYIPVLQHPIFYSGLVIFASGICLLTLISLVGRNPEYFQGEHAVTSFGLQAAVVTCLFALLAFGWSYVGMEQSVQGESYYEYLFWGGGHLLQFCYTLLMLVTWLWLAQASGSPASISIRTGKTLFAIALAPVFLGPLIYLQQDVFTLEHRLSFTHLMKYGGLTILPLIGVVLWSLLRAGKAPAEVRHLRASLYCSIFLFGAGGLIGFMIREVNVVIPAHYHGSIIGVTIAFMGLAYYLLPRLGYPIHDRRLAFYQPYIYAVGQTLHIIGLAWSGGYGVQRKTAGSAQGLENLNDNAGVALQVMGIGGLLSIIGGALFLVVAIRALWKGKKAKSGGRG